VRADGYEQKTPEPGFEVTEGAKTEAPSREAAA
jgi:hypothetical protein